MKLNYFTDHTNRVVKVEREIEESHWRSMCLVNPTHSALLLPSLVREFYMCHLFYKYSGNSIVEEAATSVELWSFHSECM